MINGDNAVAQKHYRTAVERSPSRIDPLVYNNLAVTLSRLGRPQEALAVLKPLTNWRPPNMEALVNSGAALMALSRADLAIDPLEKATAVAPSNPTTFIYLAQAVAGVGRTEDAGAVLHKATMVAPQSAEAYFSLGTVLANINPREAIEALERATTLEPSSARGYINIGHALQLIGRNHNSEKLFRQAVALEPRNLVAKAWLGSALTAQKKYKQAIPALQQATKGVHEKLANAYNNLGVSFQVLYTPNLYRFEGNLCCSFLTKRIR